MILAAAFALCLLTVPLLGGRLSRLATIRIRRHWAILAALGIQVVIISIIPDNLPAGVGPGLHLASYGLTLWFVAGNWRIPGMAVLTLGGLANLVAIGANGGVMPASQAALEFAGRAAPEGEFINSEVQEGARLLFLGDIMALPEGMPFANVFSAGDVLLVLGGTIVAHRAAGSRLPFRSPAPDTPLVPTPAEGTPDGPALVADEMAAADAGAVPAQSQGLRPGR